jgi:Flp pilus assembly protein TadD
VKEMKFNLRTSFFCSSQKKINYVFLVLCAVFFTFAQVVTAQPSNQKTKLALAEAKQFLQNNRLDEAENLIRKVLTVSSKDIEAKTLLGVILDRKGNFAAAEKEYKAVLQLNPKVVPALANLGVLLLKTNRTEEAVKTLEKVLLLQPNHEQAAYNLAVVYSTRGDYKKSLPLLEKVVGITPNNKTPKTRDYALLLALAKSYAAEGKTLELNNIIVYVENLGNTDVRVWFTLGLMLAQVNQYESAVKLFEKVNFERPNNFDVLYNLGISYYNINKFEEAQNVLLQALSVNQNSPELYYRLGLTASAKKDSDAAVSFWLKALEVKQNYAEVNFLIGEELLKNKKNSGAVPFYEKAAAQEPDNTLYQMRLGVSYFRVQRYNQARAIFEKLAGKYPKNFNLNYLKGYTARAEGLYDEAIDAFEKALIISPNNPEILANLAFIANQRGDIVKAEKMLRDVLRLDPKNFPAHYDLGRLLIKQKEYAEALLILERGAELNKNDPGIRYQLFIAYSRLKQNAKADSALAEFKRLEKEFSKTGSATAEEKAPDLPDSIEQKKP